MLLLVMAWKCFFINTKIITFEGVKRSYSFRFFFVFWLTFFVGVEVKVGNHFKSNFLNSSTNISKTNCICTQCHNMCVLTKYTVAAERVKKMLI